MRAGAQLALAAVILAGCGTRAPAPVVERAPPGRQLTDSAPAVSKPAPSPTEARPESYTVKPGDTLYSIALEQRLDYRDLAIWNGLDNPGALRVGQQLRLTAPAPGAIAAPLNVPGGVDARPLSAGSAPTPPAGAMPPSTAPVLSEPKGARFPYSEKALAQLARPEPAAPARVESQRIESRAEPRPETRPESRTENSSEAARGPDDLDWSWPAKGKVIGHFNEGNNKGIVIAGKLGQPVLASAPGRVIFSGSGIRGFGKLIVIKHNNTFLSVYAHNNELVVKEGQNVTKGQKIAEMGSSDADRVKLYFEIRRFARPIDPMKLLPSSA